MKKLISAIVAFAIVVSCLASMTIVSYANVASNAEAYVFTIENTATTNPFRYKFVLLETDSESDSSRFFVIGSANYGAGPIHKEGDNSFSWDPTDPDTLSGYLNGVWWNATGETTTDKPTGSGSGAAIYTLIPEIKEYIDVNHEWPMPGYDSLTTAEKTTITCGVTSLSRDEHEVHKEKIGYVGDTAANHSNQNWLLRSPQTAAATSGLYISNTTGNRGAATITSTYRFRPCFWLSDEFFANVKLDLENTGSAVIDAIRDNYTKSDLAGLGYTEEELNGIFVTEDENLKVDSSIVGTTKPGYTLAASHGTLPDGAEVTYQWQQADAAAGPFADIAGATEDTYTLKNAQGGKYVRVMVKLTKDEGTTIGPDTYSDAERIDAALTPGAADASNNGGQQALNLTYRLTIPETVEGMEGMNETARSYFLLDDTGSGDSKFLLIESAAVARLATDATQGVQFTDSTTNNKFDPDVEGGIAYWLKNTYATGSATTSAPIASIVNENKLAPAFIPYLDTDHEWLTEGGCTAGPCTDDYIVESPAAILSVTELKQYRDRFGWAEGLSWESGTADFNMLRTPRQNSVSVRLLWRTNDNGGSAVGGGIVANAATAGTGALIRPVFWLSEDVFKEVKLDVTKMGDGVKEMLRETYTKAELAEIYTDEELAEIGFESVSVDDVLLSGIPTVGSELEVNFDYTSSNPDADVNVSIQWMYSNTPDDGYTNIPGATSKKYVIDSAYAGKYIKAKVTPLDSSDNPGTPVMSNHLGLIGVVKPITVTNPVYAQVGDDYQVTFTISNTGETTPVYIIIAAYKGADNVMIKVNPQEVSVVNGTDNYSALLEDFTPDADTTVRGFVWNSLTEMIPLY